MIDRCLAWEVLVLPACQVARKDNSDIELQVTTDFCLQQEIELCGSNPGGGGSIATRDEPICGYMRQII